MIPESDEPKEACGVFGVYAPGEDVARLTFYGLYALQHRGQESAGIATSNGKDFSLRTGMGLVSQVFDEEDLKQDHLGKMEELIEQLESADPDEATAEVFESYSFDLCASCRRRLHRQLAAKARKTGFQ